MAENGKEDEQLLQDASTLLMFANVAAKQQHEQAVPNHHQLALPSKPNLPHILDIMNPPDSRDQPYQPPGPMYPGRLLRLPPLVTNLPQPLPPSSISSTLSGYKPPHEAANRYSMLSVTAQVSEQPQALPKKALSLSQLPVPSEKPVRQYANIEPKTPVQPQISLRRSSGEREVPVLSHKSPSPLTNSPGPANVTLARGINLASGERNNDNARIAAAALAAAADIPFPLRRDSLKKELAETIPAQTQLKPALETEEDPEKTEDELSRALVPPKSSTEQPELLSKSTAPLKSPVKAPPLEEYRVDPDAGVIGCICGIDDDDGFTVLCDICFRWQHCVCMGFLSNDEVPEDEYKCYYCDSSKWGKIDAEACRVATLKRLQVESEDDTTRDETKYKRKQLTYGADTSKRRKTDKAKADTVKTAEKKRLSRVNSSASVSLPKAEPKPVVVSKENDQVDEGNHVEPYQSVYYKLRSNDYKRPDIKQWLSSVGTNESPLAGVKTVSAAEFKNLKLANIIGARQLKNAATSDSVVQVKCYSENAKQKFNGITRMGLYLSHAKLLHQNDDETGEPANTANDDGTVIIPENTPIIEYFGEINKFENYKKDVVNQYSLWGSPKPNVVRIAFGSVESPIDLVLDARFVGNEARFIRKSCPSTSNCKIVPYYVQDSKSFRFVVVSTKPIKLDLESPDEELRLDWEWDKTHPIRKMYDGGSSKSGTGFKFDHFNEVEKSVLISGVDNILNFVECGCSSSLANEHHNANNDCAIFKVKKATSYLLRSTRKASGISNVNITKSKDELIPRKPREFVSWKQQLVEREQGIRMELHITTKDGALTTENADEKENNGTASSLKSDGPLELPYKQQLLKDARLTSRAPKTSDDKNKVDHYDINKLPVPISDELSATVATALSKKDNAANLNGVDLQKTIKEEPVKKAPVVAKLEQKVADSKASVEVAKPSKEERPTPTVKKLSFADYKKKISK